MTSSTSTTTTTAQPMAWNVSIHPLNQLLHSADLAIVAAQLASTHYDIGVDIGALPFDEWASYVAAEFQTLPSKAMSWRDGHVFITELPLPLHTALVAACNSVVEAATGTSNWHLKHYRSAMVASLSLLIEPDCSYGPDRGVGGSLPRGLLSWAEYHTVKVEIGVTRGWTQLDAKAGEWHRFPGVQYIVCIHVSSDRRVREYKLYDVVAGQPLAPVAPRPIEATTVLSLDSRRLLGLPASERFPTRFAQPSMRVSLSEIVTTAIAKQTN